jgi:hypothetical protein
MNATLISFLLKLQQSVQAGAAVEAAAGAARVAAADVGATREAMTAVHAMVVCLPRLHPILQYHPQELWRFVVIPIEVVAYCL